METEVFIASRSNSSMIEIDYVNRLAYLILKTNKGAVKKIFCNADGICSKKNFSFIFQMFLNLNIRN